jgi:hypothetical protein
MFAIDRRAKVLTLAVMCFAVFTAVLGDAVVTVALVSIRDHLGSGESGQQSIIDAPTQVFAAFMSAGGPFVQATAPENDLPGRELETAAV